MRSLFRILKTPEESELVEKYINYPEFKIHSPQQDTREPEEEEKVVGEEEVEALLAEAMEKAEEILNSAREEADKIRDEAYGEGHEKGMQQGYQDGVDKAFADHQEKFEKELKKFQKEIGDYARDMQIEKEKLLEKYIDDLKNISLAIGEKIVQTSLRSSSDVVKRMILSATEKLKKTAWAKIYVGSGDESMDIQGDAELLNELSRLSDNVKIIVMEEEEPGTCIIELPDEVIDISVETQLENIKEILNNARL